MESQIKLGLFFLFVFYFFNLLTGIFLNWQFCNICDVAIYTGHISGIWVCIFLIKYHTAVRIYIYKHAVINRAVLASVSRGWFCSWSVYSQCFSGTWWQSSVLSCVITTCLGLLLGMSLLTSQKARAAMSSLSCCCCQGGRRCSAFFCFTAAKCRHRNSGTSGMYW